MSTGNHLKNMAEEKCHKIEKCFSPKSFQKTSKFDWKLDDIRVEKISKFLE